MKRKNDINNYESKHLFQLDIEDYYERLNNLLSLNETRKTSELIEFIDLEKINTVLKIAIQRNNYPDC